MVPGWGFYNSNYQENTNCDVCKKCTVHFHLLSPLVPNLGTLLGCLCMGPLPQSSCPRLPFPSPPVPASSLGSVSVLGHDLPTWVCRVDCRLLAPGTAPTEAEEIWLLGR